MQTLNVDDYMVVNVSKNLASSVGGWIGRLDLNVNVLNNTATYEVTHNGKIKYMGPNAQDAAQAYNAVIEAKKEAGAPEAKLKADPWKTIEPLVVDYAHHLVNVDFWSGEQRASSVLDPAYAAKEKLKSAIEQLVK